MKDKAINDALNSIENKLRHVYNQGYEDGLRSDKDIFISGILEQGREEAWECARKITETVYWDIENIFNCKKNDVYKMSASEAIAKLKEYEEKQTEKNCDDCEYALDGGYCGVKAAGKICIDKNKWTPKQTQKSCDVVVKSCDNCRFGTLEGYKFPCSNCSGMYNLRWQPKEGAEE